MWGEEIDLTIEVVNRKLLPLAWLDVEDDVPTVLAPDRGRVLPTFERGRSRLVNLLSVRPYERVRRHYRLRCETRGEHVFGPALLRSGDPFGFRERQLRVPEPQYLLIYPRVVPIERLGLSPRDPFGEVATRSWLFEDPMQIVGARDYSPRDAMRRVHWPATARSGSLQVKVYQPTTSRRLMVLLNLNTVGPAWWAHGYRPEALEMAITAAASICAWADERGWQVGLAANGNQRRLGTRVRVPPARDPRQLTRILEALARAMPIASGPLSGLLRDEQRTAPHGTTFVVVSARTEDDALAQMRSMGLSVTLIAVADHTVGPMPRGVTVHRVDTPSDRQLSSLVLG